MVLNNDQNENQLRERNEFFKIKIVHFFIEFGFLVEEALLEIKNYIYILAKIC